MSSSLDWYLTGGAANTNPNLSLGGVRSSTLVSETPLNNLFDDIAPEEALAGDVEYRAVSLYNSGDANATSVVLWFVSQTTSSDTEVWVGVDSGTQSVANEGTAPATPTISWSKPTSGSPLSLANIAPASEIRLWFKWVCNELAVRNNNDQFELALRYA